MKRRNIFLCLKNKQTTAFWLVAYAFAATMVGTTLPTPLYPIYSRQLGFHELTVTIIYGIYAVGVIAALLVFGKWSDQIGRRPLLFGGLGLSSVSAILFLVGSHSLPFLVAGRVFSGLSAGVFTGTATAAVVELGKEAGSKHATMVATAANMGGLGLGPLVAGLLSQYATLPLHLCFIVDLALLVVGFWGVWAAPETVDIPENPSLGVQKLSLPPQVRGVFIPASVAGFAGFAVFGFFTALVPAVLTHILDLPNHAIIGVVVFIIFMASIGGQYLMQLMSHKKAMVIGCVVLIAGAGLTGGGLAAASLLMLVLGAVVSGLGQGLIFRAGMAEVTAASPKSQRGEVTSLFFVVLYVAISIPVIGIGVMVKEFGLRTAGIDFAIGIMVLTFIALVALVYRFIFAKQP